MFLSLSVPLQSFVAVPCISAVLVLDQDGNRVAVKYYSPPPPLPPSPFLTLPSQLAFEKRLFHKLHRSSPPLPSSSSPPTSLSSSSSSADILPFESHTVVYKAIADITLYILAHDSENELIVANVLSTFDETLHTLFKGQINRKTLIENLDLLLLTVDEVLDQSSILEVDAAVIVQRVCMITGGNGQAGGPGGGGVGTAAEVPISEQSFTQALQTARDQLVKSFR